MLYFADIIWSLPTSSDFTFWDHTNTSFSSGKKNTKIDLKNYKKRRRGRKKNISFQLRWYVCIFVVVVVFAFIFRFLRFISRRLMLVPISNSIVFRLLVGNLWCLLFSKRFSFFFFWIIDSIQPKLIYWWWLNNKTKKLKRKKLEEKYRKLQNKTKQNRT